MCTATIRAWPPSLKADSVPGMRIEPGNSPAETTAAGRSGDGSAAVRLVGCCGCWCLSPDCGRRCGRRGDFKLTPFLRVPVRPIDPLLQRRQCSPLFLDDSSLEIERRALVGKKLPQLRNRRVSTRRRLRERGTGKHEQGNDSQDAEPNMIRPHRGVLLRRLQVRRSFERPRRRCDAPRGGIA